MGTRATASNLPMRPINGHRTSLICLGTVAECQCLGLFLGLMTSGVLMKV